MAAEMAARAAKQAGVCGGARGGVRGGGATSEGDARGLGGAPAPGSSEGLREALGLGRRADPAVRRGRRLVWLARRSGRRQERAAATTCTARLGRRWLGVVEPIEHRAQHAATSRHFATRRGQRCGGGSVCPRRPSFRNWRCSLDTRHLERRFGCRGHRGWEGRLRGRWRRRRHLLLLLLLWRREGRGLGRGLSRGDHGRCRGSSGRRDSGRGGGGGGRDGRRIIGRARPHKGARHGHLGIQRREHVRALLSRCPWRRFERLALRAARDRLPRSVATPPCDPRRKLLLAIAVLTVVVAHKASGSLRTPATCTAGCAAPARPRTGRTRCRCSTGALLTTSFLNGRERRSLAGSRSRW